MLLLLLMVTVFLVFMPRPKIPTRQEFIEQVNACPPHKWRHAEVKDQAGNILRYKIVCDAPGCAFKNGTQIT